MNKKIPLGIAIALMALIATVTFSITMLFSRQAFNRIISAVGGQSSVSEKFSEIDKLLRNHFLFPMDEELLANAAATGFLAGLDDPYAAFLSKQEYAHYLLESKGELVGIGVQVKRDATTGHLIVTEVYPDTPAALGGIKVQDTIVMIDGQDISQMEQTQATSLIQGKVGTRLTVTIRRDGKDIPIEMQRKKIQIPSIKTKMIDSNLYIQILQFNESTTAQFQEALDLASKKNATGLIFDLRDNAGGTLDSVVQMLDPLLPEGVIVYEENVKGEQNVIAKSDANELNLPMVTLTNGRTASAAELFVIALKDYDKAPSVGVKTFGKGIMQTTFALTDGSAIRFTTAYFNPPKSKNFHGVGIPADYEVSLTTEQEKNLDLLTEATDLQLIKAIDVLSPKIESQTPPQKAQTSSAVSESAAASQDNASSATPESTPAASKQPASKPEETSSKPAA